MQPSPRHNLRRLGAQPVVLLTLAPLFWSSNVVIGRAVAGVVPPIGLAFWRWLVGALLLWLACWPTLRRDWAVARCHLPMLLLLALLGIALFNTLLYVGLRSTTAVNGVLLQSLMPLGIVACSWLLFGEALHRAQLGGLLLSLGGVLAIVSRGDVAALVHLRLNGGDLLILAAVISYAAYSALLRRRPPVHALSFLSLTFTLGVVLLLPFYLWEQLRVQPMPFNRTTLLVVGYLAICPSILAYLCYNRGVELLGANRAGLFLHLMPLFGSLLAALFLGERVRWFHGLGALLILSGIALATRSPQGAARSRAAPAQPQEEL